MTQEQKIIRSKVGLLELAKQLGNVSQACKMMGYMDLPRFRGEMRAWDQALWLDVMLSSGLVAFFGSAPGGAILPFSNRRPECKRFPDLSFSIPFFCSTAPQAFFRPDRRLARPPRAAAVNDGPSLGPPGGLVIDGREHGGRAWWSRASEVCVARWLLAAWRIDVAARSTVLYAVQLHWPHHGLRVSTPLCPERAQPGWRRKNRAVVEARPGRDSFRCFSSERVSIERPCHGASAPVGHRNVVLLDHIRCRRTASLRATAMVAFLPPMRSASARPHVCNAQGRANRLSRTLAASNRSPRTMLSPHLDTLPARSTSPD